MLRERCGRSLALHRVQHVIHDIRVLVLRAEQDDLGVVDHANRVAGRQ